MTRNNVIDRKTADRAELENGAPQRTTPCEAIKATKIAEAARENVLKMLGEVSRELKSSLFVNGR